MKINQKTSNFDSNTSKLLYATAHIMEGWKINSGNWYAYKLCKRLT